MPANPIGEPWVDQIRRHILAEDWASALRVAVRFRDLGEHEVAIARAWECTLRPEMYRQMGHDPEAIRAAGIAALRERFTESRES